MPARTWHSMASCMLGSEDRGPPTRKGSESPVKVPRTRRGESVKRQRTACLILINGPRQNDDQTHAKSLLPGRLGPARIYRPRPPKLDTTLGTWLGDRPLHWLL